MVCCTISNLHMHLPGSSRTHHELCYFAHLAQLLQARAPRQVTLNKKENRKSHKPPVDFRLRLT